MMPLFHVGDEVYSANVLGGEHLDDGGEAKRAYQWTIHFGPITSVHKSTKGWVYQVDDGSWDEEYIYSTKKDLMEFLNDTLFND